MSFKNKIRPFYAGIKKHPLARKHKLRVLYNFLKWQISQIIKPGIKEIKFVENTSLLVQKGMTGATRNIYFGLHEFEEMAFLLHFLQKEDIFYDVGANIGSYTILAAGVCSATVLSFEPVPAAFFSLTENIRINKLENLVTPFMVAVGATNGSIKFSAGLDTVNHVLNENEINDTSNIVVPVIFLDGITDSNSPSLIKIDVEGYETEVLNGMTNLLKDNTLKAIIIELNGSGMRYGYQESLVHEKLLKHDFLPYIYDGFNRNLILLENYNDSNTIYIREIELVKERLQDAAPVKIFNETF